MDGLLESFSSLCVRRTMRQRRVHRACFVSLFTPSPSFRCCLPVSHSSLSSHSIYISHSLLSYSKGLLFKFERFFPPQGRIRDTAPRGLMITRRFDADRTIRMNISFDIGCEYWRERWNRGNGSFE